MLRLSQRFRHTRRTRSTALPRVEFLEGRALLAPLLPGNPIVIGAPSQFSGVGTANVGTAISAFKTALGNVDNTATPSPQGPGFRSINWDGVKLDGTDFGGGANTTVIAPGSTVGIPQNRFQSRGVFFETVYAVSGDGFATVNPAAAGLFPAFSPKNTFAMFNDNSIDFSFVTPSGTNVAPAPAASRGFGAVFLNVEKPNTTSIEYFAGSRSLGKFFAPVSATNGDPEFLGELFGNSIVTKVSITLGTDALFSFDGKTFTAGGTNDPANGKNLVVTDDFFYSEPVPISNVETVLDGSQGTNGSVATVTTNVGVPASGVVATFFDAAANKTAANYFAVINWGDGHLTNGVVTANANGGFDVSGTNTFASAGLFPIVVTASDFSGNTVAIANTANVTKVATQVALASSSNPGLAGQSITFTATVKGPAGGATPTGNVTFLDGKTSLGLVALDANGQAKLTTTLSPGTHSITAIYNGDGSSASSTSTAISQVINADVTSLLTIIVGSKKKIRRVIHQKITLKNLGSNPIGGPVLLVLDNLTANVRLVNQGGTTSTIGTKGSPFIKVSDGPIAVGQSLVIDLQFSAKNNKFSFVPRVLSGVSQP